MKRRVFVCPITVFSFSSKGMDLFSLNRRELDGTGPCNKKPEIKTGLYRLDFLIRERVCSTLLITSVHFTAPEFLIHPRNFSAQVSVSCGALMRGAVLLYRNKHNIPGRLAYRIPGTLTVR